MGKRLVLAGYFGRGNLGDDAILLAFTRSLAGYDYDFSVICGSPKRLSGSYGLTGVGHLDFKAIQATIESCDALVFPGGSIFQDVTSVRSVAYYSNLVKAAKKAGKKVVLLGQGVGPLDRFLGKRLAASAFGAADAIVVRDKGSAAMLKSLGVRATPQVSADMAFLLTQPESEKGRASFGFGDMKAVGVSVRPVRKMRDKAIVALFAKLIKLLSENKYVPVMIEMDRELDRPLILQIAKLHGGKVPDLKGISNPTDLQRRLARMEAVIGMRLHSGVLAATVGVPAFMISYDPKIQVFSNAMGFPAPPNVKEVTAESLFSDFQTFKKSKKQWTESVRKSAESLAQQAERNIEVLVHTVGT